MRRLYERKQKNKDRDSAPVYKSGYGDALKNNLAKVMERRISAMTQIRTSCSHSIRTAMKIGQNGYA